MKPTPEFSRAALLALVQGAKNGMLPKLGWRRWLMVGAALVLVSVLGIALTTSNRGGGPRYVTSPATSGNLVVTVSASGTLQPTKSVDVGSELSGTLESVQVQENEVVKKGQILAQLDLSKLKDAVAKSAAAVAAAEATVAQTRATVAEAKATLARYRHVAELSGGKVPSRTEMDAAEAAALRAVANEASAQASVAQARATLKSDETNIAKATIRSPVDGVVLTRKVEPGQTVAASMTTPVLFVIAESLTRMELQVKVDEADVAGVEVGQSATFTVSAWPKREFPATIQRVGIGSTTTDNVVTYKTILQVSNDDLALRPGMTATASIVTAIRENVLLVPNAALRFSPTQGGTVADSGFLNRLVPRPPEAPKARQATTTGEAQVWVLNGNEPQAVRVKTGVSNGRYTEILGDDLKPGMAVISEAIETRK